MTKKIALLLALSVTTACSTGYPADDGRRGLAAVNVPVVERQNFAYDVPVSSGGLSPASEQALGAWFSTLGLRYGDRVYLDGTQSAYAYNDVARIAGQYGLLLAEGAPVTQGSIDDGNVRIVVSRAHASMPGCHWEGAVHGNPANEQMERFGCSVNGNLAAMVANPEDLISGRPGAATVDARTSTRAVRSYRDAAPTGDGGLQKVTTGGQ